MISALLRPQKLPDPLPNFIFVRGEGAAIWTGAGGRPRSTTGLSARAEVNEKNQITKRSINSGTRLIIFFLIFAPTLGNIFVNINKYNLSVFIWHGRQFHV